MYNRVSQKDIEALTSFLSTDRVITGDNISHDYSHDELGGISHMPEVLVKAGSTEEVTKVMKYASEI